MFARDETWSWLCLLSLAPAASLFSRNQITVDEVVGIRLEQHPGAKTDKGATRKFSTAAPEHSMSWNVM
jgi:hypothetical protein